MASSIKMIRQYTEEYMMEVGISIVTPMVSLSISCYTTVDKMLELGLLCDKYVQDSGIFVWEIGSIEYSMLTVKVHTYDKYGHVLVELKIINNKNLSRTDRVYCECSMLFDLGQIEQLSHQIKSFSNCSTSLIILEQL